MLTILMKNYEKCYSVEPSMILGLSHDKYFGWYLDIVHKDSETTIFSENNISLNLLCAKACITLKKWAKTKNIET